MGLLERIGAAEKRGGLSEVAAPADVRSLVADFALSNQAFHCVVLKHGGKREGVAREILEMTACHGAACGELSGKECVVLFPAVLDMELFSHRVSKSSGSTVAFQFTADSHSAALESLRCYLP